MTSITAIMLLLILYLVMLIGGTSTRESTALEGKPIATLDPEVAVDLIYKYNIKKLPDCYHDYNVNGHFLSKAILSIEYVALKLIEEQVETFIVYVTRLFNLTMPDLSIGPAQIRPSTLKKIYGSAIEIKHATSELMTICGSLKHVNAFVINQYHDGNFTNITTNEMIAIIRKYNGQKTSQNEHLIYNSITLGLAKKYRKLSQQPSE